MEDRFNSMLSRSDLVDLYVDTHQLVRGTVPRDFDDLNRAGLVDRIEVLVQEAKALQRRQLAMVP